jgi:glycosyltransferase involved in cell wall biosynthesis
MSSDSVSIIIPCYRQAHFLGQTIESALAQDHRPTEVIVINDGSDDDTEKVARGFGDKIQYHWQPNAGLPAARNKGISLASGKYLLFLDSDDLLHPHAVKWLVDAAQNREDVLCVMGFTRFIKAPSLDGDGEHLPRDNGSLVHQLMVGNLAPPHACMCSRSLLTSVGGFDVQLKSCEDWDAWLRLVQAGAQIVPVRRVGAFYRQHTESMSRNLLRMARCEAEVIRRTLQRTAGDPDQDISKMLRKQLARKLFDAGHALRAQGDYGAALREYADSIRSGGLNRRALTGILKLAPHWMARRARSADRHPVTS